jgi:hypothetical protein
MMLKQTAFGLDPRSVSILTDFRINVQSRNRLRQKGKRIAVHYLDWATIIIRQLADGELAIEIEPP